MAIGGFCSVRSFTVTVKVIVSPRLACDLVEKHGFIASQAKGLYFAAARLPPGRSRSRPRSISVGRAIRAAIETGDLTFACFAMY